MKRHRFDPLSFVFGVLLLAAVSVLGLGSFDVHGTTMTWIGAGVMLLIGFVLLIGSRSGKDRSSTPNER